MSDFPCVLNWLFSIGWNTHLVVECHNIEFQSKFSVYSTFT